MNANKQKKIKLILNLNLIIGIHNIVNFSLYGYNTALIIGILNIGVWAFLRDMKLIPGLIKIMNKQ